MNIDIKHIAKLARLKIAEEENSKFEKELSDIISMCEKLPQIDGVLNVDESKVMVLRSDDLEPSLHRDEVLKNAPQTQAGCVVVPKTVE